MVRHCGILPPLLVVQPPPFFGGGFGGPAHPPLPRLPSSRHPRASFENSRWAGLSCSGRLCPPPPWEPVPDERAGDKSSIFLVLLGWQQGLPPAPLAPGSPNPGCQSSQGPGQDLRPDGCQSPGGPRVCPAETGTWRQPFGWGIPLTQPGQGTSFSLAGF